MMPSCPAPSARRPWRCDTRRARVSHRRDRWVDVDADERLRFSTTTMRSPNSPGTPSRSRSITADRWTSDGAATDLTVGSSSRPDRRPWYPGAARPAGPIRGSRSIALPPTPPTSWSRVVRSDSGSVPVRCKGAAVDQEMDRGSGPGMCWSPRSPTRTGKPVMKRRRDHHRTRQGRLIAPRSSPANWAYPRSSEPATRDNRTFADGQRSRSVRRRRYRLCLMGAGAFQEHLTSLDEMPRYRKLMMNVATPDQAFSFAAPPNSGSGWLDGVHHQPADRGASEALIERDSLAPELREQVDRLTPHTRRPPNPSSGES